MTTLETLDTRALIDLWPLSDDARVALLEAVSTRGKWAGYLLASAPSEQKRPRGYMAWQAMVSNLAPSRVSMVALIFANREGLFDTLSAELDKPHPEIGLSIGEALRAVEPDFRWNMYAHRIDTERMRDMLARSLRKLAEGVA